MIRGVRADRKEKEGKAKGTLLRNKSKSRSRSPVNSKLQKPKTSRDKKNNKGNRSPSISRSKSKGKKDLNKSKSSKKIKRDISQPKIKNNSKLKGSPSSKLKSSPSGRNRGKSIERSASKVRKSPNNKQLPAKGQLLNSPRNPEPAIKQEQKDMGLILNLPDQEKIILKAIDTLDPVLEKFLEMIMNDNDASYVMNALPQFRDLRKEDDTAGRDFISGRITRLSGVFEALSVQSVAGPLRKVPIYYAGQCGKNLTTMKITIQTKFKIMVDVGFLQYSLDGDKITIFRIYVSRIYRRMNYTAFVYLEALKGLMEKHPAADRWSIFILERNMNVHKFFKYMGLKIEKIITDSKIKNQVDYYQQFTIKKKELQTSVASFK